MINQPIENAGVFFECPILAKVGVVSSNLIARSNFSVTFR